MARDGDGLARLVEELGAVVVGHAVQDLLVADALPDLVDRAWTELGGADLVLIGHGWLPDQVATESDVALAVRTFEVNLLSAVRLIIPVANRLEAQGSGKLAVITSVAGMRGRPRNFTYGAAKAGLSTYLQGVRSRLYWAGVTVHDLRPGPVITPMTDGHVPNALFATPERVASAIVRGVDRGRQVVYLPWYWWPIMQIVTRVPESVFQRFGFLVGR